MSAGLDPNAPWLGLGLALALGGLWLARRRGPAARRAARVGLVLLLALAACGPRWGVAGGPRLRVVVLDRSRSLRGSEAQGDRAAAAGLAGWSEPRAGDRVALVVCGADAQVLLPPTAPAAARARIPELLALPTDDWGTDLAGALRLASGLLPPAGGEVLVISDGRDPAAEEASEELLARGVPVHCFAPQPEAWRGVRLAALDAPERVPSGAEFTLTAALGSARGARGDLRVERREGREWVELRRAPFELGAGEERRFALRLSAPALAGALELRVRAQASGPDSAREDDALTAWVVVGRSRRVVVCGRPLPRLASRSLSVTSVRPSELRAALAAPPDLLVLSDVSAPSVQDAVPALEAALQGGMGLAVVGLRAFGPGGYAESPLEELLPVRSGPAQERERRLAVVVCLDASGTMKRPEGASRYHRALQRGVPWDALRPEDALGVVLFNDQARVALALGPRAGAPLEELARAELGGGTSLVQGLAAGLELLAASPAEDRLLLLASDAEDDPRDELEPLRGWAARLAGERAPRILLVGIEARELGAYQVLADALRPLEVEVARASDAGDSLRALLQSELVARQHAVREGSFGSQVSATGAELGLEPPAELRAYVPVRIRTEAERGSAALGSVADPAGEGAPWGVLGRRGRGAVAALPLAAEVAEPLVSALAGRLLRPAARATLRLEQGEVRLTSPSPLPGALSLEGHAGAERWTASLEREAPGLARGRWRRREPPGSAATLIALGPEGPLAYLALPPRAQGELGPGGPDFGLLNRFAQRSGGRLVGGAGETLPEPEPQAPRPWAPWLAALAAGLLLGEAALCLRRPAPLR